MSKTDGGPAFPVTNEEQTRELREAAAIVEEALPKHEASLSIIHNEHLVFYEPIERYCRDEIADFVDGEKEKILSTGEIWVCHWYPDTPVGFYRLAASTLPALLAALAARTEGEG